MAVAEEEVAEKEVKETEEAEQEVVLLEEFVTLQKFLEIQRTSQQPPNKEILNVVFPNSRGPTTAKGALEAKRILRTKPVIGTESTQKGTRNLPEERSRKKGRLKVPRRKLKLKH